MADEAANAELKRREANPGCAIVLVLIALIGPAVAYAKGWGWIGWTLTSLPVGFILLMALGVALPESEDEFRRRQKRRSAVNEAKRNIEESAPPRIAEPEQELEHDPEVGGGKGMSIKVVCQSCGTPAEVPDNAAGMKGKCRKCGAIVRVPDPRKKVCVACGTDVGEKRRFKDPQGNYYCEPCHDKRHAALQQAQNDGDDNGNSSPQSDDPPLEEGFARYSRNGLTFVYPTDWRPASDAGADGEAVGLMIPNPNHPDLTLGFLKLQAIGDDQGMSFDRLLESVKANSLVSLDGFRLRRRLPTRSHLLSQRNGESVTCPEGGFEYYWSAHGSTFGAKLFVLAPERGPVLSLVITTMEPVWDAISPIVDFVAASVRYEVAASPARAGTPIPDDTPYAVRKLWELFDQTVDSFLAGVTKLFRDEGLELGGAAVFEVQMYLHHYLTMTMLGASELDSKVMPVFSNFFQHRITGEPVPESVEDHFNATGMNALYGERFRLYQKTMMGLLLSPTWPPLTPMSVVIKILTHTGDSDVPKVFQQPGSLKDARELKPHWKHDVLEEGFREIDIEHGTLWECCVKALFDKSIKNPLRLSNSQLDRCFATGMAAAAKEKENIRRERAKNKR